MTSEHIPTNEFGRRLLPTVFDQIAKATPDRFYATIPKGAQVSDGYQDITFQQVKNAVDTLAWTISKAHGSSHDFTTICYVGEPDLRTAILFLAAVKCGYKLLLVSPRNPVPTNISLMKQTGCRIVYHSAMLAPLAKGLAPVMPEVSFEELAPLTELIANTVEHFEFPKTFENAVNDPVLILHSSGSTGNPKPITMTHGSLATIDASQNLREIPGRKRHDFTLWNLKPFGRFYSVFPPFHMGGFVATVIQPIYSDAAVPVLGPALLPPTGAMVLEILQTVEIVGLFVVPSMIEQMAKVPDAIQILQKLKFVCYAGGPLATDVGNQLCKHVDLCQFYGTTETISPPQLVPTVEDWEYMTWHPDFKGTMEPSDDDTFELVYHYEHLDPYQSAVLHNLPNLKEYRTKDLFKQHTSKPGLWRFHGRKDDIIVLANGEKFNPVPMEIALSGISSIAGAVVVGQGKSEATLLLEASAPVEIESEWIEKVWPDIEKANTLLPGQGRIMQSRVLVGSAAKPFARAGKGTVVRKLTADLYKDELEALYRKPVAKQVQRRSLKPRFVLEDIQELMSSTFTSLLQGATLGPGDDLFAAGLDSVKSAEAVGILKAELEPYAKDGDLKWLDIQFLYSHASVDALSEVLSEFLNNGVTPVSNGSAQDGVEQLIEKFTQGLPTVSSGSDTPRENNGLCIGIVGSRGSLGSAIVQSLEKDSRITNIFCIDRISAQSVERQTNGNTKLHNVLIDYTKADLGLSKQSQDEGINQTDILIFNAWPVDFNLPVQAFTPNLQALRYLIDSFAKGGRQNQTSAHSPHIVFVSSIAAANVSLQSQSPVTGYGQSKFVAEQILSAAARASGVQSSILRIGQIAPGRPAGFSPGTSTWPSKEWFPALCKASQTLQAFPDDLGNLDWIRVDSVGDIVKEIAIHNAAKTSTNDLEQYTVVNPHTVPWSTVVDEVRRFTGNKDVSSPKSKIQFVPLTEWIAKLESYQSADKSSQLQAVKLLPFFQGLVAALKANSDITQIPAATDKTAFQLPKETTSSTFTGLKPISQSEIQDWIGQFF